VLEREDLPQNCRSSLRCSGGGTPGSELATNGGPAWQSRASPARRVGPAARHARAFGALSPELRQRPGTAVRRVPWLAEHAASDAVDPTMAAAWQERSLSRCRAAPARGSRGGMETNRVRGPAPQFGASPWRRNAMGLLPSAALVPTLRDLSSIPQRAADRS
jgi:hypothetical protein